MTKDKINKILNDERVEFKNENEEEILVYEDSQNLEDCKGLFYDPKVNAANWFIRQVLYDKANKII